MKRKVRGSRWRRRRRNKKNQKNKKIYGYSKTNFSAVSDINHCPNGESTFGDKKNRKRGFEYVLIFKAVFWFVFGATAPSGPVSPYSRGF
jgi:hypothetical protein